MRNARLQAQDLGRTNQFVHTLLSKDDVKDLEKPEIPEIPKPQSMVNGNGIPFRTDPKARFSDPPAPPPQQPLPEKPDVPSLKRGPTERPKIGTAMSPRQDNLGQIFQLTEALKEAKRDMDTQTARMRELEDMLQREREARELAEELAKRLEESTSPPHLNGSAKVPVSEPLLEASGLEEEVNAPISAEESDETGKALPETDPAHNTAAELQARIDSMESHMRDMKEQMEQWKQRCESAEAERDADRKTLAEMVVQLREEEAQRVAAQEKSRSRSRRRKTDSSHREVFEGQNGTAVNGKEGIESSKVVDEVVNDILDDKPNLSRVNTITPLNSRKASLAQESHLQAGIPYASMLGVVLVGMGLMAYINGWQQPPRLNH